MKLEQLVYRCKENDNEIRLDFERNEFSFGKDGNYVIIGYDDLADAMLAFDTRADEYYLNEVM